MYERDLREGSPRAYGVEGARRCITCITGTFITDTSLIYSSANRNTPHVRLLLLHVSLCVFLTLQIFQNF